MISKKEIEKLYLQKIRATCPEFPPGHIQEHEEPDFLVTTPDGIIYGVELRCIYHSATVKERPRKEIEGIQNKIALRAQTIYQASGNPSVNVCICFSYTQIQQGRFDINRLAQTIAGLVSNKIPEPGALVNIERLPFESQGTIPYELCSMTIYRLDDEDESIFSATQAGPIPKCDPEYLQACINEKEQKLANYRKVCSHAWLVLTVGGDGISSQFNFPTEVLNHTYTTSFDKVYLFNHIAHVCIGLKTLPNQVMKPTDCTGG